MIKKLSIALVAILTLGSCAREFNKVYRTTDTDFKYEYAKECYVQGKYSNAVTLLQDLVTIQKGTDNGQECLFMLAMAEYQLKDYEAASETFKKYKASTSALPRHDWTRHRPWLPSLPSKTTSTSSPTES